MTDLDTKLEIEHQPDQHLFYVLLDDGQRAFLKYRRSDDKSATAEVDFWSTFVPESQRATGLAAKLVEHGFKWAKDQGLHIKASCWYAAKEMEKQA